MKCECGEIINGAKSITIFDTHVETVTSCKCDRSIHKSFDLASITFFKDNKLEKYENVKK